jgi:hypothetical protein
MQQDLHKHSDLLFFVTPSSFWQLMFQMPSSPASDRSDAFAAPLSLLQTLFCQLPHYNLDIFPS